MRYSGRPICAPPLRASCSYPGLFVPIQFDGRMLVDGFLTAPVPVEGCFLQGADVVIAVHLEPGNLEPPRTFTDVLSRSFNIIQRHADVAWRQQADVVIEPDVEKFVWDDFSKTPEMVAAVRSKEIDPSFTWKVPRVLCSEPPSVNATSLASGEMAKVSCWASAW